jgi:diguanylate cyclase (GGDEF)-like protein
MSDQGEVRDESGESKSTGRSSLRVRWTLGLGTLLLLTLATGAISLIETRRITSGFESSASEVDRESAVMNRLRATVGGEVALAHQFIDFGAGAAPAFLKVDGQVDAVLREARTTYDDAAEHALIDSVRSAWDQMFAPLRPIAADAARANSFEADLGDDDELHHQLEKQFGAVQAPMQQLDALARDSIQSELASARSAQQRQTIILAVLWIVSGAFTLALGRRFARGVLQPIQDLWHSADRFSNGEMHHRAVVGRADELGQLALRFNAMADSVAANHERLTLQAFHDSLTGLTNRAGFLRELHAAFSDSESPPMPSVLFIDLDDFKFVNDSMGHDAGDSLLVEVAKRLEQACRSTDIITRLGGDEFAVLIDNMNGNMLGEDVALRILDLLAEPFTIQGTPVRVGASIGLATRTNTTMTVDELIRRADIAMYTAKGRGKNRLEVFEMSLHGDLLERAPAPAALASLPNY